MFGNSLKVEFKSKLQIKTPNTSLNKLYKTAIFDFENYGVLTFKIKKFFEKRLQNPKFVLFQESAICSRNACRMRTCKILKRCVFWRFKQNIAKKYVVNFFTCNLRKFYTS